MRSIKIGLFLLLIPILFLIIGLVHPPYNYASMQIIHRFMPPSWQHPFGTDEYGRDILTRVMIASQNAFIVSIGSVGLGLVIGCTVGAAAGYLRGWVSTVLMRSIDGLIAFPGLLLALLIVTVLGVGKMNAILAIAIFNVPLFARLTYGFILNAHQFLYVKAAYTYGAGHMRVLFRHMLPSAFSKVSIQMTTSMAGAILTEAALSFLGLGVQPPHPSWGGLLSDSQSYFTYAPWYPVFPGLIIFVTVMGFNLLGDGLRELQKRS